MISIKVAAAKLAAKVTNAVNANLNASVNGISTLSIDWCLWLVVVVVVAFGHISHTQLISLVALQLKSVQLGFKPIQSNRIEFKAMRSDRIKEKMVLGSSRVSNNNTRLQWHTLRNKIRGAISVERVLFVGGHHLLVGVLLTPR